MKACPGCPVVATLQGGYQAAAVATATECVLARLAGTPSDEFEAEAGAAVAAGLAQGAPVPWEVGRGMEVPLDIAEEIEARLEARGGWWEVERSFNHGLQ